MAFGCYISTVFLQTFGFLRIFKGTGDVGNKGYEVPLKVRKWELYLESLRSFHGNRLPSMVLCMGWVLRSQWFSLDMNIQNSSAWFLPKKDELLHILTFYVKAYNETILPIRGGLKLTLD